MSNISRENTDGRVKQKVMGWQHIIITYVVMLLLVGLQVGIIVLPVFEKLSNFLKVNIILGYWAIVALIFSLITNMQIANAYDKPVRRLGEAAKKVAKGDFSVFVEPMHSPDKYDYIDVMVLDFNVMVQELGSIETLKNDFIANVSHEIKTPLAIIKNYATMLKKDNLPEETRLEYMDSIIKATDNLSVLVTNILKLNKLENQEIEPLAKSYDLCRQLSECVLTFESIIDEKNFELVIDLEDRVLILANEKMLELVWNNLLSNAFKFTEAGGKIAIKQTSEADTVTVSISDSGCGMKNETLKHIFDKFYQGDNSNSFEGNGLGLAIAHRIVEKADGTLYVQSEEGKGSIFTVTLPLHKTLN